MTDRTEADLHFVFLQGAPSPFFRRVGKQLSDLGCRVTAINLCVGDAIFWRGRNAVNYQGKLSQWPAFVADYFEKNHVTDIVLLGENRSYHKPAVEIAKARGIRVTVMDFGYLRPDWITFERDGMTSNSRFPRNPEEIIKLAASVPQANLRELYADSAWKMAIGDLLYSFSNVFLGWLYPHYRRSDRRPHPIIYFPAIGRRLLLAKRGAKQAVRRLQSLIDTRVRYFVFALQLEHDYQIVAYSNFDNLEDAIRMVMASFAVHASGDSHLIIKVHPWDPGLRNWERIIARLAKRFGVGGRVGYFDGGDLDKMIIHSVGMITVNSTSGIRALQLGFPVITLGDAIYDIAGLTYQGTLDNYWSYAACPDANLTEAFINAMAGTIQIRGVLFREPGLSAAVSTAVARLHNGSVGMPVASKTV